MTRSSLIFCLVSILLLGLLVACTQSEGERCEQDEDCDPLVCTEDDPDNRHCCPDCVGRSPVWDNATDQCSCTPETSGNDAGTGDDSGNDAGTGDDSGNDAGTGDDSGSDAGAGDDSGSDAGTDGDSGGDAEMSGDSGSDGGSGDAGDSSADADGAPA